MAAVLVLAPELEPVLQQLTQAVAAVLVLTPEVEPVLQQLRQLVVGELAQLALSPDPNETFESA